LIYSFRCLNKPNIAYFAVILSNAFSPALSLSAAVDNIPNLPVEVQTFQALSGSYSRASIFWGGNIILSMIWLILYRACTRNKHTPVLSVKDLLLVISRSARLEAHTNLYWSWSIALVIIEISLCDCVHRSVQCS